jgi:hypothetical protein
MLKKMSAALILASLLAGPAMAAGPVLDTGKDVGKSAPKTETAAPMIKSDAKVAKPDVKADVKPVADSKAQVKPAVLDAKAQAVKPHRRHIRHHHRFHEKLGMHKTFKHVAHKATVAHIKRG